MRTESDMPIPIAEALKRALVAAWIAKKKRLQTRCFASQGIDAPVLTNTIRQGYGSIATLPPRSAPYGIYMLAYERSGLSLSGPGLIPASPSANAQTPTDMHARIPLGSHRKRLGPSRCTSERVSIHAAAEGCQTYPGLLRIGRASDSGNMDTAEIGEKVGSGPREVDGDVGPEPAGRGCRRNV